MRSACRNYKCRFDEQILIYAQRPDATAVLEIEKWNRQFGRWVNKGATGIAVFDGEHNGAYRLKHYFDISDTHESRNFRPVPLWQMEPQYEAEIIETLENSFGELDDKSVLAAALISTAQNAVDDNITDYLSELMACREDSYLEELDDLNVEVEYRTALQSSVAYMLLFRCGIDPNEYLEVEDFRFISDFNTANSVNALGVATSDIAESGLREIAITLRSLQRQAKIENRTFAKSEQFDNNKRKTSERSTSDESIDISIRGRLPDSEPITAGRSTSNPWQVRITQKEISARESQSIVHESTDVGQTERTPDGNSANGNEPDRPNNHADGTETGSDGTVESRESNELGGSDEQYQADSGGDDTPRPDTRIKPLPTEYQQLELIDEAREQKSFAFSISQQIMDEVLTSGGNEIDSISHIISYFKKDHTTADNAEFLSKEYGTGGKGFIFGENHVSTWFDDSGIHVAVGDTALNAADASLITWEQTAKRIRQLLDVGRYAPQDEIDKTDGIEIKAIADHLWHLHQDLADGLEFSFLDRELFRGGFPDSTIQIAELVAQPHERHKMIDGLQKFATAYEQNRSMLRFHLSAHNPQRIIKLLTDLQREPLVFTADESVSTARPGFITQDEVDKVLTRGGEVSHGKFRIYSYFLLEHTNKEKVTFLKDEYGTGGNGRTGFQEWHDSKGLAYSRENNHMPYDKVILPWAKVARRIDELIADSKYMNETELAYIPEYEKGILADQVYSFYYNQPEEVPHPYSYGSGHSEGVKAIRLQLDESERVKKILNGMAAVLDNTADFDRHYESMKKSFADLTAYQNGEYSLFTAPKPAEKEQGKSTAPTSEVLPEPSNAKETAKYDLQLGISVYLGIDEYEIYSFDDTHVVLRDMNYPLFTKDMSREEFDRKLRENRLNDGLIKADTATDQSQSEPEANNGAELEAGQSAIPKVGDKYKIDGRQFIVDSVDTEYDKVSLRDITFENSTGFPIFRSESFDFIRWYEPFKEELSPEEIIHTQADSILEEPPAEKEDVILPAWEQPKPQNRTNQFDPHSEIPMTERNNYQITDDTLGVGGAKAKFQNNMAAIKLLQTIESENRFAAPEEQEILAQYVGWGGLAQAFDENNTQWTNEYHELRTLLTPEEYKSAVESTLNAHYTSPTVIKAIYKAIENMGFKAGNVLEPSCGIGNFFGLVPESMKESKLFGVELDSLTGRIARQLYQKNRIAIQGFETTDLPDSFFDLAVGNVPFGNYKILDKRYDKHKFQIHDYFFARTLDKVRPEGIIAFITSKGTLDKENSAVRKYIAQRADLLGAIRLPNTAFKANAGTEVTADIIFLQKRDRIIDIEPDWVHLGRTEEGIPVNSYFAEHPDMILGTMSNDDGVRMYGNKNSTTCVPYPDSDLSQQLAEAITNIHAEVSAYEIDEDEQEEEISIPADPNVRNFSYTIVDGQIYYRQDSRMVLVELPVTTGNRVKGMVELRECVRTLIAYQTEDYSDRDIEAQQAKLNRLYDAYSKKYGLINSRGNSIAFSQDSAYCLLCSLEIIDENGELESKAAMFNKRTIKPHIDITHVDTASEALAVSLAEKARVDLSFMAALTDMSEEAIIKELEGIIFLNIGSASSQADTYVTADEYLSGDVRQKLEVARAAAYVDPTLSGNVKALEVAMPEDLTAAEISVRLGATWLPEDVVQQFMYELLQTSPYAKSRIKVHYSRHTGEWNITEKSYDRSNINSFNTYGTQRINAYSILEQSLNLRDVRVWDKVYDENGDEKRVLDKKETAIAQAKQEIIRSKFEEWIWKDPDRRERLCRIYNDTFNSIRPREYDGSHIKFVGMNPEIKLRKHQVDAIARILYGGNTLLAHEVGAGYVKLKVM